MLIHCDKVKIGGKVIVFSKYANGAKNESTLPKMK